MSKKILMPKGWILAGSAPENYNVLVDKEVYYQKGPSVLLKSPIVSDKFGTFMQTFRADIYRGKRIRYSAWVKTADVESWAGLWMRIDGIHDTELGFDNMHDRPIKLNQDWKSYNVVLDVPVTAEHIAFGLLLVGKGTVWINGIMFEEVGSDVPVTGRTPFTLAKPVNLDFSQLEE